MLSKSPRQSNTTLLSHIDCPGGGQVWVEGTTLYVGHMRPTSGTTIIDVADPRAPRVIAKVAVRDGWHSHKVRVSGDIMIVNQEKFGKSSPSEIGGGIDIYDVANPASPKLITEWRTIGGGVHRFDFDGRYAYISPTVEGYIGNIVMIFDLADPANPVEVSRWWMPGQWQAGGEEYPWHDWVPPRCHHPLRHGDRLYVSYWHHGFVILDISDLSKPKLVSHHNTSPAFPHPTHTCLVMPKPLKGRTVMVVADEDVAKLWPAPPSFAWVYDITTETAADSDFHVPGAGSRFRWQSATGDDRMSPAVRTFLGHSGAVCVVCPGTASGRLRRSVQSAGSGMLRARCGAGCGPRLLERRNDRWPRPDLFGRSG